MGKMAQKERGNRVEYKVLHRVETTKGNFDIELAQAENAEDMLMIFQKTADLMVQQGLNQWTPSIFSLSLMENYLAEREVYILKNFEGKPVGIFTLQESDPSYWGDRNDDQYDYLHRLAILPEYRGLHLGEAMIQFAEKRVQAKGKRGLRLDCVSHLESLNRFYSRQGYEFVDKQNMGTREVHLYEKRFPLSS